MKIAVDPADKLFLEDGSIVAWSCSDGLCFLSVTPEDTSHQHRGTFTPEVLAPMLLGALRTQQDTPLHLSPQAFDLLMALLGFVGMGDARTADENAQ